MQEQVQQQETEQRECRHFLWLTVRLGKREASLWASCRSCSRSWFLGAHADVMAGLAPFECGC